MLWGPGDEEEPSDAGPGAGSGGGWVPPESRTWRHPSELHAAAFAAVFSVPRHRWRRRAAAVGAVALVAVVVGTVLLVETGSTPPSDETGQMPVATAAVTPCCRLQAAVARGVEETVVSITGAGGSARAVGCGVVVGDGLVATTSAALRRARRVRVLTATGRLLGASVMAADPSSGIVLLRLSGELAVSGVQAATRLEPGAAALAVAMQSSDGSRPAAMWTSGTVVSVGVPAPGDPAGGMAAITVRAPEVPPMPGEALVDRTGGVEGILVGSKGADRDFLPMPVVVGVAAQLETMGRVHHGWLDVTDVTAPGHSGAAVVTVDPSGAAAGRLRAGDVIVSVDGAAVASSAALRSMLYALPPGTEVRLDAVRGADEVQTVVRLAPSP